MGPCCIAARVTVVDATAFSITPPSPVELMKTLLRYESLDDDACEEVT